MASLYIIPIQIGIAIPLTVDIQLFTVASMANPNLVTIRQALEERPYMTERWLRRLRAERRVPTYTAAGRVLFDLDALDELIESTRLDPVR